MSSNEKGNVQTSAAVGEELKAITQELFDALAPGEKSVWEKHLSEDCVITDEEGNVYTKADFLAEFGPLPPGYSGHIQIGATHLRESGDAAVLTHRDLEQEEIFGQKITAEYQTTSTFVRRDGRWLLMAMHITVIPRERKAAENVSLDLLAPFLGTYELAPSVTYTITREGDRILGQRSGGEPEELIPAGENVLFRKGTVRGEKVFVRDDQGLVTQMIDRRDNNEIVWRKLD